MSTPFDPQPLTEKQKQQIADNVAGSGLIKATIAALVSAKAQFIAAEAVSVALTQDAVSKPAIEVDVEGLINAEINYQRLQDLVRNLGLYLQAAQGWRASTGQPNHESFTQLLDRLKKLYPDVVVKIN